MREGQAPSAARSVSSLPETGVRGGRDLHLFLLADCSGSMTGEKIASLNYAMRTVIPAMRDAAEENAGEVLVRMIRFASGATWHVTEPTPVAQFRWHDLTAGGETDLGAALLLLAPALESLSEECQPIIVLVSDGQPTDDFDAGLQAMLGTAQGRSAIRIAIAIGYDADLDMLESFIGNPEIPPLQAFTADELVDHIAWAATAPVGIASSGAAAAGQVASHADASGLVW